MGGSKVFFTDFHTNSSENLLQKFRRLLVYAGFKKIDLTGKFVALKIHFGERGNLAFLRPNYVRVVVDLAKEMGGKPFLTDSNTLYVGSRKNALDHLSIAYENGFNPFVTGCHVIIADGLKGTDEVLVPVNGTYVKQAKIGRAVMDADVFVSLTHFKMHECTGIGGTLKNIGMGCGSRAGKMEMHSNGKPTVNQGMCIGCGTCVKTCAHDAISFNDRKKVTIDKRKCAGCGRCIGRCSRDAIYAAMDEKHEILNKKICEYSLAVVHDRPCFHVSFIVDVSPFCDCHSENDVPVVPNVGMLASFDPVALDVACAEIVNSQPLFPDCILAKKEVIGDYFQTMHPTTNWRAVVEYGASIGLGKLEYDLIRL